MWTRCCGKSTPPPKQSTEARSSSRRLLSSSRARAPPPSKGGAPSHHPLRSSLASIHAPVGDGFGTNAELRRPSTCVIVDPRAAQLPKSKARDEQRGLTAQTLFR